ncbi:transposase [Daeguia caeni]|uniref:Transposase n=1 Tax=Daeguia caeni TaxID=439612 RepID=A0ABV9H2V7_9HYPH
MARISPHFPLSYGVPRGDDRRMVSGIVYVIRNGLQWKDAPGWLRPAQNALQPLHPLEQDGCVQPHLRRARRRRAESGAHHDRRQAPESSRTAANLPKKGMLPVVLGAPGVACTPGSMPSVTRMDGRSSCCCRKAR